MKLSTTQRKLLKTIGGALAAIVFAVVAFLATLFVAEDEQERVVQELCQQPGLVELAQIGRVEVCTHGPDPEIKQLEQVVAARTFTPVPPQKLCSGNGEAGARIHVFRPTGTDEATVIETLGFAQKYLNLSSDTHRQRLRFLCVNDQKPVTEEVAIQFGTDHFSDFVSKMRELNHTSSDRIYLLIGNVPNYPYCGQGSVGVNGSGDSWSEDLSAQYSVVACLGSSRTTLHEIGHNIGVVIPPAPHSSGDGWHCFDSADLMCYNDGGTYFRNGGTMQDFGCRGRVTEGPAPTVFDCNQDDYWSPAGGLPSNLYNSTGSRFFTKPKPL